MNLTPLFHAVKTGSTEEKAAFWHLCKTAAASHPQGVSVGLTKVAFDIWAASYESGVAFGVRQDVREAFAGSFGSAAAVEGELAKLAQAGQLNAEEHEKLAGWVAESAIQDLSELTKRAGAVTDILKKPQVMGAMAGFVIGAGIGAWSDDKDRARGALAGALPGALMGAAVTAQRPLTPPAAKTAAQKLADIMSGLDQGGQPPMDANQPPAGPEAAGQQGGQGPEAIGEQDPQISDKIEGLDRGSKTIDNMIFLAQQVQLPQLAQELDQMRDQLTQHFADGNAYLPPELQHHFAQSEHAEAFMKKYKQRFGPVAGGGSKKTASFSFRSR